MEAIQIFNQKNIRITPQRIAVYRILKEKGHASAEEIYQLAKKDFPMISFATVYSILELFKKRDIAQELRIGFQKSTFDIRTDGHHHFMCRVCGKIYDIDIAPCAPLKNKKVKGHKIESFQGYFYGVCKNCKRMEA